MKVEIINNANELETLEPFEVSCLLWEQSGYQRHTAIWDLCRMTVFI